MYALLRMQIYNYVPADARFVLTGVESARTASNPLSRLIFVVGAATFSIINTMFYTCRAFIHRNHQDITNAWKSLEFVVVALINFVLSLFYDGMFAQPAEPDSESRGGLEKEAVLVEKPPTGDADSVVAATTDTKTEAVKQGEKEKFQVSDANNCDASLSSSTVAQTSQIQQQPNPLLSIVSVPPLPSTSDVFPFQFSTTHQSKDIPNPATLPVLIPGEAKAIERMLSILGNATEKNYVYKRLFLLANRKVLKEDGETIQPVNTLVYLSHVFSKQELIDPFRKITKDKYFWPKKFLIPLAVKVKELLTEDKINCYLKAFAKELSVPLDIVSKFFTSMKDTPYYWDEKKKEAHDSDKKGEFVKLLSIPDMEGLIHYLLDHAKPKSIN